MDIEKIDERINKALIKLGLEPNLVGFRVIAICVRKMLLNESTAETLFDDITEELHLGSPIILRMLIRHSFKNAMSKNNIKSFSEFNKFIEQTL